MRFISLVSVNETALHKEREQKEEYENDVNKLVKNVDQSTESDGEL